MSKTIEKNAAEQFMAGVSPKDSNIEFIGVKSTKTVLWLQNGKTKYFKDLPPHLFELLQNSFLKDPQAMNDLQNVETMERKVELYTYYMYGDLDSIPDISKGRLSPSENFRDNKNCISQHWASKEITIDGVRMNNRDITILDSISQDFPDKAIANILGISMSTFNWHKQNLLHKTNCATKVALAIKAQNQKVLVA
ncbi:LuxR family transcriptional regulator protein [Galbibacter marinus]|uniref:LuxR family transcriptional regulator protein n=1 Tax=Galbibacter marinus TaxID=555500 RepID=K2QN01_9FLAO|nr:LuxR C-terminal-related transcriptional regulator [Galbibacter marinus]EKF56207.1 LuxR family transcriptional regulator protein [Galbibacter marinus]